jgi:hypothetical protein
MSNINTDLSRIAMSPTSGTRIGRSGGSGGNWFESFAEAWGRALDNQANTISNMADNLKAGGDKPSDITMLTAESMRMSFMSQSSHTSLDSISKALETMARKG